MPPPVTNAVPVTVAVHDALAIPRWSVTVTVPSGALVVPLGAAPGRAVLAGTVIASAPPAIVIEVALLAVRPVASVTLTVKLNVPAVVGVPASTPVDAGRVRPGGRLPALTDQV